jgi:hypothetical protein
MVTAPMVTNDPPARLTEGERMDILIPHIARLIYDAHHGPDDTSFDEIDSFQHACAVAEARGAVRMADAQVFFVAVEHAAQAYALAHGWSWPRLEGYAVAVDPSKPAHENEQRIALARLEARQKIRHIAKQMVGAFVRYLRDGNPTNDVRNETQAAKLVQGQHAEDSLVRQFALPKPQLRAVDGGRL